MFVSKSHSDFALPFWNIDEGDGDENSEYQKLDIRYGGENAIKDYMPLNIGDFTAHSGWTLHCSNSGYYVADGASNLGQKDRLAIAISYVDARAQVREEYFHRDDGDNIGKGYDEDKLSFKDWIQEVKPREFIDHNLVPIVWPPKRRKM